MSEPHVGIVMGSDSDLPVMKAAAEALDELGISYELTVISGHRTPHRAIAYGSTAHTRGLKAVIAGAGGAAHLAGMISAVTPLPVIGVPLRSSISIDGWDSVLSVLQMPPGVPVATVALDGARNAGILAAQIIGTGEPEVQERIVRFKAAQGENVLAKARRLADQGYRQPPDELG